MGLFSFTKSQLLKVIEWTDTTRDTIVYKFPMNGQEIMMGSKLTVREGQVALFVNKGKLADVFLPGVHSLKTSNLPLLTKMFSWHYGYNSPFKAEVYFVSTRQFTSLKWGTQNPITMRDKEFGTIRIRGYGSFAFRVSNPTIFLKELFGTNTSLKTDDIASYSKSMLISYISDAIAESKISALDLACNLVEFNNIVKSKVNDEFEKMGMSVTNLIIENISFPEAVEKAIDTRSSMGILGQEMDTFVKYQAAHALRESASNPNGNNIAGMGVGLGAGTAMGSVMAEGLQPKTAAKKECPKCSNMVGTRTKFCGDCGHEFVAEKKVKCVHCNVDIKQNTKFCSECGKSQSTSKVCKKCKTENAAKAKFCVDCGEKI